MERGDTLSNPFSPGKVLKMIRSGYRAGSGVSAVILRNLGVLIQEAEGASLSRMSWIHGNRLRIAMLLAVLGGFVSSTVASDDPEEDWISAFGWLQTGQRLEPEGYWPLVLGSYMEAHRKMKQMREEHPGYEREMVEYRIGKLEEEIAAAEEKLAGGDRDIMVKFVDFAESFETGLEQRFDNQFVEAMNTLEVARVLLDEIIFENPEVYRDAVASQYELLESSLAWLDSQINFREREREQRNTFVGDGVEWGTTQFVQAADLPAEGDSILVSGELFPGFIVVEGLDEPSDLPENDAGMVEPEQEEDREKKATSAPIPGFRMSSKQSGIPELPEGIAED